MSKSGISGLAPGSTFGGSQIVDGLFGELPKQPYTSILTGFTCILDANASTDPWSFSLTWIDGANGEYMVINTDVLATNGNAVFMSFGLGLGLVRNVNLTSSVFVTTPLPRDLPIGPNDRLQWRINELTGGQVQFASAIRYRFRVDLSNE